MIATAEEYKQMYQKHLLKTLSQNLSPNHSILFATEHLIVQQKAIYECYIQTVKNSYNLNNIK